MTGHTGATDRPTRHTGGVRYLPPQRARLVNTSRETTTPVGGDDDGGGGGTVDEHRTTRTTAADTDTDTDTDTVTEIDPDQATEVDRPWVVIVWNDPINLMSYVTWVLQKLFGYSVERATELMLDVHHKGRAAVAEGSREQAEMHVFRLHEHGLWATMEHDR